MASPVKQFYDKYGTTVAKNFESRQFEAYYCSTKEEALEKALSLIPTGSTVGWGGTATAQQVGLLDAIRKGDYNAIDREKFPVEERDQVAYKAMLADYYITGANALSEDGQMVNVDGRGNRVGAICFGPKNIIVIAGMNKVCADLEAAVTRARTVAAPINHQRFSSKAPCTITGVCEDCKSEGCICNQVVITRRSRPANRIKIILVGENLGF